MRYSAAFVALAVASAPAQAANYNYTSELDIRIDPNSVSQTERATWCQGQTNTCRLLCNADASVNSCTESTLEWNCTCTANSSSPGIAFYKQTMPFYICEKSFSQCITDHAGDAQGQDVCNNNIKPLCAKLDPPKSPVAGGSDGSSTSTTGSSQPSKTSGSSTEVPTTSSKGLAGPTLAPVGNGAFVAAMGLMAFLL